MTPERYLGTKYWAYRIPGGPECLIEISVPSGSHRDDEGMARYCIRKKLGVKSLPRGTKVYPWKRPSR